MKRLIALFLCFILLALSLAGCSFGKDRSGPDESQMRAICELATMECYYHNVAKFTQEDTKQFLVFSWGAKDLWVEYSGIVTLGVDASLVTMTLADDLVRITIPKAKVLNCKVDPVSLNEDSYIVAKGSAKITSDDQTLAFKEAQAAIEAAATNDTALLTSAQERAQALLEDYVNNLGAALDREYQIEWIPVDDNGKPVS